MSCSYQHHKLPISASYQFHGIKENTMVVCKDSLSCLTESVFLWFDSVLFKTCLKYALDDEVFS